VRTAAGLVNHYSHKEALVDDVVGDGDTIPQSDDECALDHVTHTHTFTASLLLLH
jgi:hypothetical protein